MIESVLLEKALYGVMAAISGFVIWKTKKVSEKLEIAVTEEEVEEIVDSRLAPLHVDLKHTSRELNHIHKKIDMIIDKMLP